ncbi:hypothetical protein [Pseudomonas sp. CBC3]|uniref:hypothetical protein n=1 Tax=Pseudomonas sp. CBC3 TaxID=3123318 RepID=UPI0030EA600C
MADNWKNHPVIIATIACASTAAFFVTVALPAIEKNNQNKITYLTEQNLKLELSSAQKDEELKERDGIIAEKEKQINIAKSDAEKYKNEDRFSLNNPIPKGFRELKIFDPYNKIKASYPNFEFDENTLYSKIEIEDSLFSSAIYYPAKCNSEKIIKEIRFSYRTLFDNYQDASKEEDFDFLENPVPSISEIEDSKKVKKQAITNIFLEKFGNPLETEDNDKLFLINESIAALIDGNYLFVFSRHSDEEISKICSSASSCPIPTTASE